MDNLSTAGMLFGGFYSIFYVAWYLFKDLPEVSTLLGFTVGLTVIALSYLHSEKRKMDNDIQAIEDWLSNHEKFP